MTSLGSSKGAPSRNGTKSLMFPLTPLGSSKGTSGCVDNKIRIFCLTTQGASKTTSYIISLTRKPRLVGSSTTCRHCAASSLRWTSLSGVAVIRHGDVRRAYTGVCPYGVCIHFSATGCETHMKPCSSLIIRLDSLGETERKT